MDVWHFYLLQMVIDDSNGHTHQEPPLQDLGDYRVGHLLTNLHPTRILGSCCGFEWISEAAFPLFPSLRFSEEVDSKEIFLGHPFRSTQEIVFIDGDDGQGCASRRR